MPLLSRDELKQLTEERSPQSISIFMPTHRAGRETREDPIRLKNLLREGEDRLIEGGARPPEAKAFLSPGRQLLEDDHFWRHQRDGLAVFLSPNLFRHYSLPSDFRELVVVSDRFHVKPLLPLFTHDGRFFVLAVSQNEVRLLQATRFSAHEIDLEALPASIAEALKFDDPERQIQFHTGTSGRGGKRPAMFHGQGVGIDDSKDNILRFFRKLDSGLHEFFRDENAPLVFAGVEYLFPIYEEANTYPHLLDKSLAGNPEGLSGQEMAERAWAIVEPYLRKEQKEAAARYRELSGTKLVSRDIEGIVKAAFHGRVEVLFVAAGIQQWGTFNPDTETVTLFETSGPEAEDLLDYATVQTLLNGGVVYAIEPDRMPERDAPVSAVFRYQV